MDIPTLLSSISSSVELGKLLVNERDRQKAAVIEVDLTNKLIQAQNQISQVLAAIIEKDATIQKLSERVRELEAVQSERARYELAKLGTLETFAYKLRPSGELPDRANEPPHFLCQPCFDSGKKAVLNIGATHAYCHLCKSTFQTNPINRQPRPRGGGSWMSV